MAILASDMKISADTAISILEKHRVAGDAKTLQRDYRRRLAQRLMAGMRDDFGRREILAARSEKNSVEYVVVNGCHDPKQLKSIHHRLQSQLAGLLNSTVKVRLRLRFLEKFSHSNGKKKGGARRDARSHRRTAE